MVCVCLPSQIPIEILIPKLLVFETGRQLAQELCLSRISAIIKEA